MSNPQLSVVMSAYNSRSYLKAAIDSVLAQTFKDFELIVINDGSSDDTQTIIDSYKDPRIVKIKHKNKGLVASLNIGLAKARGEFIARHDADDLSSPQRFEKQLVLFNSNPRLVLVGTCVKEIDSAGKVIGRRQYPLADADIRLALFHYSPFAHGSTMARRRALEEAGGYRQVYYPVEDYDLWRRLAQKGQLQNIGETLYEFRVHQESISATNLVRQKDLSAKLQRDIAQKPIRLILSPLNVRRAIKLNPSHRQTCVMLLKTSLKHLRPLDTIFMLIAIALAGPRQK